MDRKYEIKKNRTCEFIIKLELVGVCYRTVIITPLPDSDKNGVKVVDLDEMLKDINKTIRDVLKEEIKDEVELSVWVRVVIAFRERFENLSDDINEMESSPIRLLKSRDEKLYTGADNWTDFKFTEFLDELIGTPVRKDNV